MYPLIRTTPKGLKWFQTGHPWIYAGDIAFRATEEAGLVTVCGPKEEFLAHALYSPTSKIACRILSRKKEPIDHNGWRHKIEQAIAKRRALQIPSSAKRLVFAEADGLPSLIIDAYGPYLVVQTLSAGLEKFKDEIFSILKQVTDAEGILERNDAAVRKKENLPPIKRCVAGEVPQQTVIEEAGLKFVVDLWEGQKTGAFLDQRDNRIFAGHKASGLGLDVFAFEGWFACHMAKKACSVVCVETSQKACDRILENARRNGLEHKITIEKADAFDFLKNADQAGKHYDTINLDPPAFIKMTCERLQGYRGYKEVNLRAMKLLKPKGLLISSSCSYHFSEADFERMLLEAAHDARTNLEVVSRTGAATDHPTLSEFPEGNYLKCYFLDVRSATR